MKRSRMTAAKRVRIYDRDRGLCHLCKLPIHLGEQWHVEHVKPLWEGGADEEVNMAPAHVDCHATKSKEEAAPRAKTTAQRAKAIGATHPAGKLNSRGFAKSSKPPREERALAHGVPEIARRFEVKR